MASGDLMLLIGFALLFFGLVRRRRPGGRWLMGVGIVIILAAFALGEFRVPLPGVMEDALDGWQRKEPSGL